MNDQEELAQISVTFAEQFGAEWLPKFEQISQTIRETQTALAAEGKECALLPNSYTVQCAQKQYARISQFCGELWGALTDWQSAMVPLYPDADSIATAAACQSDSLVREEDFAVYQREGVLVIQMPFPIKRYAKRKTTAPALDQLKVKLSKFLQEKKPVLVGDNLFSFWYVYPVTKKRNRWYYPDNDNYLTKPIIDTVCEALFIQDKGTDTYLFSATVLCSDIPPGTYLFIAPQSDVAHDFRRQENALIFLKEIRSAGQGKSVLISD